jgi:hypothetical protein
MSFIERMILLALFVAVATPIYWLLRYCIRIGAKRAVSDIVTGFRQEVHENKGDDVLDDEVQLKHDIKDHSAWYPLFEEGGSNAHVDILEIGRRLGRIGYLTGANKQRDRARQG